MIKEEFDIGNWINWGLTAGLIIVVAIAILQNMFCRCPICGGILP